jgi:Fe-S-cluster containining protein
MTFFDFLRFKYRKWRLKKTRKTVVLRGSCNLCGSCCQSICLQVEGKWLKKEKHFRKAVAEDKSLARFDICGKTKQGYLKFSCNCLNKNGTCDDYQNRPLLCRSFPAPSIFLQFGELPPGCGFRMSTEIDFEQILKKAIEKDEPINAGHIPD